MFRLLTVITIVLPLAACPGGGSSPSPDAPPRPPVDAPEPPPPPDARLRAYGEPCVGGNECQSGVCVGETGSTFSCSRLCSLDVALDCKDVDAFCVPVGGGDNACFGEIETGNDLDDAIVEIGDSVTRNLSPLGDADLFQVRLNQLGTATFTVTPQPSIDVRIEANGVLGAPIGFANDAGPGLPEGLQTEVQQIGGHIFIVVRNVGSSTGGYTLAVARVPSAMGASGLPPPQAVTLRRAP